MIEIENKIIESVDVYVVSVHYNDKLLTICVNNHILVDKIKNKGIVDIYSVRLDGGRIQKFKDCKYLHDLKHIDSDYHSIMFEYDNCIKLKDHELKSFERMIKIYNFNKLDISTIDLFKMDCNSNGIG